MREIPPHLPASPGVYSFLDGQNTVLYIGKAKNISKRIQHYFTPGSLRKQEMVRNAARIERIETASERDALLLEDNMIKKHLPEYNSLLRNNTNYVFLKIPKRPFPTFTLVRKRANDASTYVGPRYGSKQLRQLLRYLRQVFKFHTMTVREFAKGTLSSDYFFGLDKGRSVIALMNNPAKKELIAQAEKQGRKAEKSYEEYLHDYQKIITLMKNCFSGKTAAVLEVLKNEIHSSIQQEHFERCAQLKQLYEFVQSLEDTYQQVVLKKPLTGYVAKITHVAQHWVIILLNIVDGKIVDIIRQHLALEDQDLSSIQASLGTEFGTTELIKEAKNGVVLATPSAGQIQKKERKALMELLEKNTDSYIETTVHLDTDNIMHELLLGIQKTYDLKRIPLHMECIDISHLGGDHMSGGLSSFRSGLPDKPNYRQYKITKVKKGTSNDYEALKEVLVRRYKLQRKTEALGRLPDLLIIDGGKGQLNILKELTRTYPALEKMLQEIDIVALGKGEARQRSKKSLGSVEIIYKFNTKGQIVEYPLSYDAGDHLLVKLRDEAHRFANRYRKKRAELERRKK